MIQGPSVTPVDFVDPNNVELNYADDSFDKDDVLEVELSDSEMLELQQSAPDQEAPPRRKSKKKNAKGSGK